MYDKGDYYLEQSITSIIISYGIRSGKAPDNQIKIETVFQNYQHHKLPITVDPLKYGKLIDKTDNKYIIQVNNKNIAIITVYSDHNEVNFFKEGNLVYSYKDYFGEDNTFIRVLGRKEFHFKDNEVVLLKQTKPVKFLSPKNHS
jgi:hypothetical protein